MDRLYIHSLCADKVSSCRFLGYQFNDGDKQFIISAEDRLEVIRQGKIILKESGQFRY